MPLTILCQDDFPEWEKIEFEGFSNSAVNTFEINNKNQLSLTLPTGVFISENQVKNWVKLKMPDSIVYNKTYINKNIIVSKGIVYDYNHTTLINTEYLVISSDYGISWKIYPFKYGIEEDSLYQYWNQSIHKIDEFGNFWGVYKEYVNDSKGRFYIYRIFNYDYETGNKITKFELSGNYHSVRLLTLDSTIFAFIKDYDYLYVFRSTDVGQTWDTLNSDNKGTKYFDYEKGGDFYGNNVVYTNGKLYLELSKGSMVIDIENKTYDVFRVDFFAEPYEILKKNESEFYSYTRRDGNNNFSIRYSKDSMNTWVEISYNLKDIYPQIVQIDSSDNLYIYDGGFYVLRKGDTKWIFIKSTGLQYLNGGYFVVNSKSEILAYPHSPPYLMYYKDNEWASIPQPECDVLQPEQDIRFLPNDKLAEFTNCGFGITEYPLTNFEKLIVNDSLIINDIDNWFENNQNILSAYAYVQVNANKRNYYKLQTKDKCKTWEILEDMYFPTNGPQSRASLKFNKYDEFIYIGDSAIVFLSTDKGKSWKIVHDASTEKYFTQSDVLSYCRFSSYNYQTGVGYGIYDGFGLIILTLDHGRTWTTWSGSNPSIPESPLFEFISEHHYKQTANYMNWNNPEMITDHTLGYFYIPTEAGVYRSTDSLHSFHCISKGKIEPSVITELQLGYDGRLYAMNYLGYWRTKNKVTNVENDTKPDFSNSDIFIYPNPAGDYIIIQTSEVSETSEVYKVQIFDMLGIEVLSEFIHPMNSSYRMNVESLPAGVYYIRIGDKVAKFVKM